jgi:hypothetical protein
VGATGIEEEKEEDAHDDYATRLKVADLIPDEITGIFSIDLIYPASL